MIAEFDVVELRRAMPQHGLVRGQAGVVVHVFEQPNRAYEVEFCNEEGETLALLTLQADDIAEAGTLLLAA